jgi:GrpB-like predicted nucleotidyltransferase (UPF0157 family)
MCWPNRLEGWRETMSSTDAAGSNEVSDEELQTILIGQVAPHNAPITIVDYDPEWPRLFARETQRVRAALKDAVVHLEHVGSTSVPGLAAKPIIDILLVVTNSADEASYVPALEAVGYVLRVREPDWFEHRLFKGPDININMHVFSDGAEEAERMLVFREWLRHNDADRERYERTKRELGRRTWRHVQHYAQAKTTIVQDILTRATAAGRRHSDGVSNRPGA